MNNDQHDAFVSPVEIYHRLGVMEAKLDSVMDRISGYSKDLSTAFDRIRQLENNLAKIIGATAVISIVVPLLVTIVSESVQVSFNGQRTEAPVHSSRR